MSTFFSGEDMRELHDNTANYPFYLSLIVNFDGKYAAKIAFVASEKDSYLETNAGMNNIRIPLERAVKNIVTFNLDIEKARTEWSPDPLLLANWTALKAKKAASNTYNTAGAYQHPATVGYYANRKEWEGKEYNPRESFQKSQEKSFETSKKLDEKTAEKKTEINWKEHRDMALPHVFDHQLDRVLCKILEKDPNSKNDLCRKALMEVNASLTDAKSRDEFYRATVDLLEDCIEEEFAWGNDPIDLDTMCYVGQKLIDTLKHPSLYYIPLAKDLIDLIASQCNEMLEDYEEVIKKEIENKNKSTQLDFSEFINNSMLD